MWDKPIYKTVCQRLCGTSQFMKQFVKGCPGQTVLWYRATEPSGVSHICKLKMILISFLGWRTQAVGRDRNLLTLGEALTVLRRQSLRVFISDVWPNWAGPSEREWSRQEGLVLQVMLAALWSECVHPPLFIGESHAFKACFSLIDLTSVS